MKATRFPESRTSIGRLFVLLAIIALPRDDKKALALLFIVSDHLKAMRAEQIKNREGG